MHEEAILGTAHPVLGPVGEIIDIGHVKAVFASTQAAKALTYNCADENCGVVLTAVIVDATKAGRKMSPSSYFRAQIKHKPGCVRVSSAPGSTTAQPGNANAPASPSNSGVPMVWIDSSIAGSNRGSNKNVVPGSGLTSSSTRISRQRSNTGAGVSKSRSQRVRLFVEAWKTMNASVQMSTQFVAPWNPGGTYHSAFNILSYQNRPDILSIGTKIHVGTLQGVTDTGAEYVISLVERNMGGKGQTVELTITKADFTEQADARLLAELAALSLALPTNKIFVYALGEFLGSGGTLRLKLPHRNFLHLD
jgi:hypothetical protein